MERLQFLAGTISSLIFIFANLSMLIKAWRTHDVTSYSLAHVMLSNSGNAVHWVYVVSLPFGPIWLLHGFFTLASLMMLFWCLRYRYEARMPEKRITKPMKQIITTAQYIRQTLEFPPVEINSRDIKGRKDAI